MHPQKYKRNLNQKYENYNQQNNQQNNEKQSFHKFGKHSKGPMDRKQHKQQKISKAKESFLNMEKEQKEIILNKFNFQLSKLLGLTTEELIKKYENYKIQFYEEEQLVKQIHLKNERNIKSKDSLETPIQNKSDEALPIHLIDKKYLQSYWKAKIFLDYTEDLLINNRKIQKDRLKPIDALLKDYSNHVSGIAKDTIQTKKGEKFISMENKQLTNQELDYYENTERYYYEDDLTKSKHVIDQVKENEDNQVNQVNEENESNLNVENNWFIEGIPLPLPSVGYRKILPPPNQDITSEEIELQVSFFSNDRKRKLSPLQDDNTERKRRQLDNHLQYSNLNEEQFDSDSDYSNLNINDTNNYNSFENESNQNRDQLNYQNNYQNRDQVNYQNNQKDLNEEYRLHGSDQSSNPTNEDLSDDEYGPQLPQ